MTGWNQGKDDVLPAFTLAADEAVNEILGEADRRQAEMRLSAEERRMLLEARRKAQEKREKARRKADAQRANRLHVLLPEHLKAQVQALAEQYRVPVSQVVAFLLYEGLERYGGEPVDFTPHLYPTRSPRYDANLIHPKDPKRPRKNTWQVSGWGEKK
jgi:hypothetical protein